MTSRGQHTAASSARSATATYGAPRWPHANSARSASPTPSRSRSSPQSLERWILDYGAQPTDYLPCRRKARHTAGQRVLDHTRGNLKAVQKLLGHSSISTTGDIYTDWDIDQLAETLREMLEQGKT